MVKAVDHPAPTATWGKKMVGVVGVVWKTVRVTATVCGLLASAGEVSVMAPEYVPAPSPAGLTETASAAGVVALAGETRWEVRRVGAEGVAGKARAAPALETETLCDTGDGDPIWCVKVSDAGVRVRFDWAETVRVTATVCGLFPAAAEVSVMAPEYVPAASPAGLTETTSVAGVVALAGETLSQLPPEVVEAAAVKESAAPVLATETLCAEGDGDPT